jgi:hypothetical protein
VSVRDEGPGIQPEHLTKIFDRFWQLRGIGRSRGTGLGLPIAKGIITAHGGRIWAESSPGAGSTFYFTLPAVNPTLSGTVSRHSSSAPQDQRGRNEGRDEHEQPETAASDVVVVE